MRLRIPRQRIDSGPLPAEQARRTRVSRSGTEAVPAIWIEALIRTAEDSLLALWKGDSQKLLGVSGCTLGEKYIGRKEIADLQGWLNRSGKPFAILA
jgi:hypothetical protein